ncbi:hypothetical protein HXX76_001358 [Chlamydomonas incerta]|uniref:Peptidase M11 gametolysin domain-containing protein n=1 Tax=Chlamydomonas incerta TaxID=51695 RepID=A0A835WBY9_CHLIN|nr:hypothetical protein HXX76_001358 [Chlamydomonas incerta]|eukprot:KAG2444614.1 hypothetical protein HXX76_001358 [Chlamydomonas incerta]
MTYWLLMALMGAACLQGQASAQSATALQRRYVQGQLYVTTDHTNPEYGILDISNGKLNPFKRGVQPPKKDKDGNDLKLGAVVGLTCTTDTNGMCTYVASTDTSLISAASIPTGASVVSKLLAIIIDYSHCGSYAATATEATVKSTYLGAALDGTAGHAIAFERCSYGKFTYDVTAFRVVTVQPTCDTNAYGSCTYNAISGGADTAAKALIGDAAFAAFTHYTYILPPGMEMSPCGWSGLALLPGKQTWLQTSGGGLNRWATVMQESVHNYGLWHSWQLGREYWDNSTAMGMGRACLNVAELSRMGWASPAAGGAAVGQSALPIAQGVTFNLPATYLTGTGAYVRVTPNWLTSYTDVTLGKNLYISVRVNKVGDSLLGSTYANRVHVHSVVADSDNGYIAGLTSTYSTSDRQISNIATTTSMSSVDLPDYKMVVYGGAWVGTDIMRVHICRYSASAAECPSPIPEASLASSSAFAQAPVTVPSFAEAPCASPTLSSPSVATTFTSPTQP